MAIKKSEKYSKKTKTPYRFKDEYCEALIKHMSKGLSINCFGATIGVYRGTIYGWLRRYEQFAEAKEMGDQLYLLFWEKLGIEGVRGDIKLNAPAWIFNMKNRFRWRDKTPEEVEEESKPMIILRPSTGEQELLTDTKSAGRLRDNKTPDGSRVMESMARREAAQLEEKHIEAAEMEEECEDS